MKRSSSIKNARLLAHMTQAEVADAVGVSQPTYQRWESGAVAVPVKKLAKLAEALNTSSDVLAGKPQPFDLLGVDQSIADERTYFGEVAVHFVGGAAPLLLPISEAERTALYGSLQGEERFIRIASLDNRTVIVRRGAISDLYFSSEAYDDFGPEKYGNQHLGIHPDDSFWKIVEHVDCLDCLDGEFGDSEIDEALGRISLTESDLDELVTNGNISASEKGKVRDEAAQTTDKFVKRARSIVWQLSGGLLRRVSVFESKSVYEACSAIALSDPEELLYLAPDGYHRSIFLNLDAIDYFAVPTHKLLEGEIESVAEELDASD